MSKALIYYNTQVTRRPYRGYEPYKAVVKVLCGESLKNFSTAFKHWFVPF